MKKIKVLIATLLIAAVSITSTGCYGSFGLTKRVLEWNGTVGDKWVNELVFIVFLIVPVYEISTFLDVLLLNSIEFWSGQNPVAMNAADSYEKTLSAGQRALTVKATRNRLSFMADGSKQNVQMVYMPGEKAWYMDNGNRRVKMVEMAMHDGKPVYVVYQQERKVVIEQGRYTRRELKNLLAVKN